MDPGYFSSASAKTKEYLTHHVKTFTTATFTKDAPFSVVKDRLALIEKCEGVRELAILCWNDKCTFPAIDDLPNIQYLSLNSLTTEPFIRFLVESPSLVIQSLRCLDCDLDDFYLLQPLIAKQLPNVTKIAAEWFFNMQQLPIPSMLSFLALDKLEMMVICVLREVPNSLQVELTQRFPAKLQLMFHCTREWYIWRERRTKFWKNAEQRIQKAKRKRKKKKRQWEKNAGSRELVDGVGANQA